MENQDARGGREQILNASVRLVPNGAQPQPFKMGGQAPYGTTLGVNSFYFTRNGKPFFPISGEFHYARFPALAWEQEFLKIKAGGINTVASYVFWNYHEARAGTFDWSGEKNFRRFVELCAQHEMYFVLRIGPFVHGEWRNGGLPDWLYGEPLRVRSNDPRYLAHVERFYTEIAAQVRGLFFADGGPIIAIQLENEYMHAGAPWETQPFGDTEWISAGYEGVQHLEALKQIAARVGLQAPYSFVTAWGGAPILEDESLPVYSEYIYPTWIDHPPPSPAYLFQDKHARPTPEPTHRIPNAYPFIMAEQQGGIQVRYNNRPIVPARSTEALTLVNLGAGCNAIGYYMYHGGTTPRGFAERLHPQRSYDFQAPLGEYGQVRANYHAQKILHLFLDAYGETLAPLHTCLPDDAAAPVPTDVTPPRFCIRTDGTSGFLFVNNFQDHAAMQPHAHVRFVLETANGALTIPDAASLNVAADVCFILPFQQSLHGAQLRYATVQPLTHIQTADAFHYFYFAPEGIAPEYCFDAETCTDVGGDFAGCETRDGHFYIRPQCGPDTSFTLTAQGGAHILITTLTRTQAEHTWRGHAWSADRVIVCPAPLTFAQGGVQLCPLDVADFEMTVFPPLGVDVCVQGGHLAVEQSAHATHMYVNILPRHIDLTVDDCGDGRYKIQFPPDAWRGVDDLFLQIDYDGDMGMAFVDGEMIADNFCNGLPWEIGLKHFAASVLAHGMVLVLRPLRKGTIKNVSSTAAARFEFEGDEKLVVHSITALPEYQVWLR